MICSGAGGSVIVHLLSLCLYRPGSMQVKSIGSKVGAQSLSSSNSFISRRISVFIKLAENLKEMLASCSFIPATGS